MTGAFDDADASGGETPEADDFDEAALGEGLPEEPEARDDAEQREEGEEEQERDDALKLEAERDEYLDSLRRLQADFDNYRKRAVRQQTELLERATEGLLVQLLPVLDALDLADRAQSGEAGDDATALSQIGTLLRDTLGRQGLERIDAVGVPFDPTVHDAVAHEEDDEQRPGGSPHEIAEVMRAGYRLAGRVLRPAMVKVKG